MKTMRFIFLVLSAFLAALPGAGTPALADAPAALVRIGGTGSAVRTLELLGAAFAKSGQTMVTAMPNLGSGGGVKALRADVIDMATMSRPPTVAEADGLTVVEYAHTPFVFAVGREPVSAVTVRQLADIYAGRTTHWPSGEQIRPILRLETDSDNAAIRSIAPELSSALDTAMKRPGMVMALGDQDAADDIATMPGAIGPTTLAIVKAERRPLTVLTLDGLEPGVAALASGRYPFFKTFYLLHKPDAPDTVKRFAAFLRSPEAQPLLDELGQQQILK